jgi:hypothetical protein
MVSTSTDHQLSGQTDTLEINPTIRCGTVLQSLGSGKSGKTGLTYFCRPVKVEHPINQKLYPGVLNNASMHTFNPQQTDRTRAIIPCFINVGGSSHCIDVPTHQSPPL